MSLYTERAAVLSPAVLTEEEIGGACRLARSDEELAADGAGPGHLGHGLGAVLVQALEYPSAAGRVASLPQVLRRGRAHAEEEQRHLSREGVHRLRDRFRTLPAGLLHPDPSLEQGRGNVAPDEELRVGIPGREPARQHIQKLVNELLREGLVTTRENPAHRRSRHVVLTRSGRGFLRALDSRERELMGFVGRGLSAREFRKATDLLRLVRRRLESEDWERLAGRV